MGGPEAFRVVLRAIAALAAPGGNQSGYSYWISLRRLPAALCFHWAASGTLLREDVARLAAVLHAELPVRSGEPREAVSSLPLAALDTVEWKVLRGFEWAHTPHSNFFHAVFASDARDVVVGAQEADEAWDAAEFWIALEFAAFRLPRYKANSGWFWTPPGRFLWRREYRTLADRLNEVRQLPAGAGAFKAGLLGGGPDTAKEVLDETEAFFGRVGSGWY